MNKFYLWINLTIIVVTINIAKNFLHHESLRSDDVYELIKHTNWPRNKESGPFVIGVLGNSNIIEELKVPASNKTGAKSIGVDQLKSFDQLEIASLVYIKK